jgi:phage shock protein PspC (stress-responsive transcriptional regulator)
MTTIDVTEPGGEAPPEDEKRLRRSRSDRWIAGVAGGLAEYFGLSAAVYRVLFVALAFAGGTGILLYVAIALVMPAADRDESILAEALRRHRNRPWLVIGLGLLALVFLAGPLGHGPFFAGPVAVLCSLLLAGAIGVIVWAARGGGKRLAAVLGVLVLLLTVAAVGAVAAAYEHGGIGDRHERPVSAADLQDEYRLGAGRLRLDLTAVELPAGETRVEVDVGVGEVEVTVPEDVAVSASGRADSGDVDVFGLDADGRHIRQDVVDTGFADADRRLVIDARIRAGELTIER